MHPAHRMGPIPFSGIVKMNEEVMRLEKTGERIIHMEVGRPDFDTPVHIKEAAKRALDQGDVHYTSIYGTMALRQSIANKLARDNGIDVDPSTQLIVTIGANEAVFIALTACLDPGDEIIIPTPTWPPYEYCARLVGAVPVFVPLRAERGFVVDPEDIRQAVTPKTKMIVLITPHNPTGAVLDLDALHGVAAIAQEHDLIVITDEVYEKLVYEGTRHHSIAALPGMADRTITINGFSKSYAMTGWRLGYVAASEKLTNAMAIVHQYTTTCAASFAQAGGVAALEGPQDCVQMMAAEFDRRRRLMVARLNAMPGVHCPEPRGAFYVFPSISAYGLSSEEMVKYLLNEAKISAVAGTAFGGANGEGFLRLAYSNSYDNLVVGLDNMEKALAKLR